MNIILYGLGTGTEEVKNKLKSEHRIIGYTDSVSEIPFFDGRKFYKLNELEQIAYDYIVICIRNPKSIDGITEQLTREYRIPLNKIIKFYAESKRMNAYPKVVQLLARQECTMSYEGIVLGLSYSYFGILPQKMDRSVCNLSIPTQDLYHDLMTLQYCIQNHKEKFESIKYAVIDLFDYHILNYDLNKTYNKMTYLMTRGYTSDLSDLSEQELSDYNRLGTQDNNPNNQGIYQELFANLLPEQEKIEMPLPESYVSGLDKAFVDEIIPPRGYMKCFPDTIQKNKEYLATIVQLLFELNHTIDVYFVMMPRFYQRNDILNTYKETEMWKKMLFEYISELQVKYSTVTYLDFREYLPIVKNRTFFHDAAHLSYSGAIAFTSLLNEMIEKREDYHNYIP